MPIGTVNAWRKAIQAGTCTSNYSQNKVFDEAGLARWTWLRSPARRVRESAAAIYSDGNLTSYPVNRSTLGLSPFFLLGEAAGYSNNTDGIKPADILKPVKTDIIERVYHTEEPEEKLFTGTEGAPRFQRRVDAERRRHVVLYDHTEIHGHMGIYRKSLERQQARMVPFRRERKDAYRLADDPLERKLQVLLLPRSS